MPTLAIESLFTPLRAMGIFIFFVGIGMPGQPVMKYNGRCYTDCKHNQHGSGWYFLYGPAFKQILFFDTMLQK
jgi:hypothetical protein